MLGMDINQFPVPEGTDLFTQLLLSIAQEDIPQWARPMTRDPGISEPLGVTHQQVCALGALPMHCSFW